jgi:hypothetical protein
MTASFTPLKIGHVSNPRKLGQGFERMGLELNRSGLSSGRAISEKRAQLKEMRSVLMGQPLERIGYRHQCREVSLLLHAPCAPCFSRVSLRTRKREIKTCES